MFHINGVPVQDENKENVPDCAVTRSGKQRLKARVVGVGADGSQTGWVDVEICGLCPPLRSALHLSSQEMDQHLLRHHGIPPSPQPPQSRQAHHVARLDDSDSLGESSVDVGSNDIWTGRSKVGAHRALRFPAAHT